MKLKCPGNANITRPTIEVIRCPKCGEEVEMFTDEKKTECKCGYVIVRGMTSCVDWCSSAKKCIGEKRYKEIKQSKQ